jgi:glycerol-3-phosphate dehydrogenase (NAD(P)+)
MTGRDAPASIAIVGAGSWGTALAVHLGRRGNPVRLWARDAGRADQIQALGANPRYLPDVRLPARVIATSRAADALADAGLVIVAVPSRFLGQVAGLVAPSVPRAALVVSATKGIERRRTLRMSEVLGAALPGRPIAVLSGPSFAREVALGKPAALVVAAADADAALRVQRELATPEFRVYTNRDVVGVEIAGALKNVIAIAAGLSDSLDLGDNARAALITRGLAEIARLGVALGASPRTFAGLAGLGDLLLTCTGGQSRNRSLGLSVGRGRSLEEAERATPMVAEGVETVASALELAGRVGVPMPICEAVSAVLFGGRPAAAALAALLAREPRPEEDPVVTLPSADALSPQET